MKTYQMLNYITNYELEVKAVYKEALPYLEKADSLNRSFETVKIF